MTHEWLALDVDPETLDLFEAEVNGEEVDWGGHPLDELIRVLLTNNERWVLVFEPDYDQFEDVFRMDPDQCVVTLKTSLKRTGPRSGFVAIPPS